MKILSLRSLLAVSTDKHVKFMLATLWLGALSLGFFIQMADMMLKLE